MDQYENHQKISEYLLKMLKIMTIGFVLYAVSEAASGTAGVSTRYWDCCKPSCSWPGKATLKSGPVKSCAKDGKTAVDPNTMNVCSNGGTSYMCASQQPWAVNTTTAYGFAAASISGLTEKDWCCACYALTFTSGPVSGKTIVLQVTNTGSDLGGGHFDIQIPGGGVGIFNGCQSQYGAPATGWGAQYGGVSSASDCKQLPADLQPGCNFRFGSWFQNADNPSHNFVRVKCPAEITAKTGCVRSDE